MNTIEAQDWFQDFCRRWPLTERYYIWGAGVTARRFCALFGERLQIAGFLDNDPAKWDTIFLGHPVYRPDHSFAQGNPCKVIITSDSYLAIIPALERRGLVENVDFCNSNIFESLHMWCSTEKVYLRRTDVAITSACSLNCKNCNMLIPYYKQHAHRTPESILSDMEDYFRWVDHVDIFNLLGGEPFLHPKVFEIVRETAERFRAKIGALVLITNGTVMPSEELLSYMGGNGITVELSDYRKGIPEITPRFEAFIRMLETHGIPYFMPGVEVWTDFNHVEEDRSGWDLERLSAVCKGCNPPFRGLYDRKFYYCHLSTSAMISGRFPQDSGDYFDLSGPSDGHKAELLAFDLGFLPKGSISYCRYCGGCPPMNQHRVAIAEQL